MNDYDEYSNFLVAKHNPNGPKQAGAMVASETSRAVQEVQASLVIAKRFPRSEADAFARIKNACKRETLAKEALYAYPKGGQVVTGPSIRMAEMIAQNWGNIDFGIRELSQEDGWSEVEAYAWDMETNTRQRKVFRVPHVRHTRSGKKNLTDPRDVYEMVANQGARRLRACILGVIPGDIVDAAVAECERTMAGKNERPIEDRQREMVAAFNEIGVSREMIEKRLGHKVDATIAAEIVGLQKIYKSIKDGMTGREEWFEMNPGSDLTEKLKAGVEPPPQDREPGSDDD